MTVTIPADRHFLPVSDLLSAGFSYYKINKLVEEGKLVKRLFYAVFCHFERLLFCAILQRIPAKTFDNLRKIR